MIAAGKAAQQVNCRRSRRDVDRQSFVHARFFQCRSFAQAQVGQWALCGPLHGRADFSGEFRSPSSAPIFVYFVCFVVRSPLRGPPLDNPAYCPKVTPAGEGVSVS